jgi:hypothetical protein
LTGAGERRRGRFEQADGGTSMDKVPSRTSRTQKVFHKPAPHAKRAVVMGHPSPSRLRRDAGFSSTSQLRSKDSPQ